jgi:uncharacterized protein YcbX
MPTVARINVTPVKSTALHHPEEWRLETTGPVDDRRIFFVDGTGDWYGGDTDLPLMLIHSALDRDADRLELRLPDGAVIAGSAAADGEPISVTYDGRAVAAHLLDGDWGRELTEHLGRPMRLARLDEPGTLVDEPVTIVSLASVAELGTRGGRDGLDATRFRMTLELDGCEPHEEDTWTDRRIAIGEAELLVGGPIPRCVITTIDAGTGRQDFPTLKVIATYRGLTPDRDAPFGVYSRVTRPGTVRVGDDVDVDVDVG